MGPRALVSAGLNVRPNGRTIESEGGFLKASRRVVSGAHDLRSYLGYGTVGRFLGPFRSGCARKMPSRKRARLGREHPGQAPPPEGR